MNCDDLFISTIKIELQVKGNIVRIIYNNILSRAVMKSLQCTDGLGRSIGFVIQKPQREWQIFNRMANVVSSPLLADTDGLIIEVADCATDY